MIGNGGGIVGGVFELFDLTGSTIVPENTSDFTTETDIDGSPGSALHSRRIVKSTVLSV